MSSEILRRIIEGSAEISMDVSFLWHGGEALMAGIEHFQEAMNIQRQTEFSGDVVNTLQSNMTLMTEEKAKFFVDNGFRVSTSLDGNRKAHDENRVFHRGGGSYARVIKAIKMFNALNYPIGSICLVTKSNVDDPDGTYHTMLNSGVTSFSYHLCSNDEDGSIEVLPDPSKVAEFTKRMFDLWLEDDNPNFKIRNFRNVVRGLCGGSPLECASMTGVCRAFIAFDSNGDVYPCHRFVGRRDYTLGNVLENELKDIFVGSAASDIYNQMAVISDKCQKCQWLSVCGAGCPFERLVENGKFNSVGLDCEMKRPLFSHIESRIRHLL